MMESVVKTSKEIMTIKEAALEISSHPNTIRRLIKSGSLKAYKALGKSYIFKQALHD